MDRSLFPLIILVAVLLGCQGDEPTADPKVVAEAQKVWDTKCATCHGAEGRGDGSAGVVLNPKPRNFHDRAWQFKVKDDYLRKIIVEGGAAVGLSSNMAPNPELADQPEVVDALIQKIRGFGKN